MAAWLVFQPYFVRTLAACKATACAIVRFSPSSLLTPPTKLLSVDPVPMPPEKPPTFLSQELRSISDKPCGKDCFLLQPMASTVRLSHLVALVIFDTFNLTPSDRPFLEQR